MHGLPLFVLLLVASTLTRSWLNQRQVAAVQRHREEVPEAFARRSTWRPIRKQPTTPLRSAQIGRWDTLLDAALALLLTLGGGLSAIDRWWQAVHLPAVWHGTAVVLSTFLLVSLIGLPLSIWRTFGVEARFGFNRTTAGLFVADLFKGLALGLLLGGPLVFVILFLMQRAGPLWWLYAWVVWVAFTVLITWAWPTLIAPLFNKFTPLSDEALKQRTEALLERCGFSSRACS